MQDYYGKGSIHSDAYLKSLIIQWIGFYKFDLSHSEVLNILFFDRFLNPSELATVERTICSTSKVTTDQIIELL